MCVCVCVHARVPAGRGRCVHARVCTHVLGTRARVFGVRVRTCVKFPPGVCVSVMYMCLVCACARAGASVCEICPRCMCVHMRTCGHELVFGVCVCCVCAQVSVKLTPMHVCLERDGVCVCVCRGRLLLGNVRGGCARERGGACMRTLGMCVCLHKLLSLI